MKRYSTARARAELSALLDAAENGEVIVIERRGVRFSLSCADRKEAQGGRARSRIEYVDPALLEGQWTWGMVAKGLCLRRERR